MSRSISIVAYRLGWAIVVAMTGAVLPFEQVAGQTPEPRVEPPPQESSQISGSGISSAGALRGTRDGSYFFSGSFGSIGTPMESARRTSPAAVFLRHTSGELNAQVEQALREIWDAPPLEHVSLHDALDHITRLFKVPIEIHQSSRDYAQLSESTPISTPAKKQILYRWLANVLEPFDCTIALDYGTLKIVADDYSYERPALMTKSFDCQDILDYMTSVIEKGMKTYSWRQATCEQTSDFESLERNQATRDLLRMIIDHVGRERFEYDTAAMDMVDGRLIVTHRYAELWQIEEFLDLLRRQIR